MPDPPYTLEVIPLHQVDSNKHLFNTSAHKVHDDPALEHESTIPYSENASSFGRWRSVVLASRGIENTTPAPLELDRRIIDRLQEFNLGAQLRAEIRDTWLTELKEDFPLFFEQLRHIMHHGHWFVRADHMSPKDGVLGSSPITTADQLIRQLLTSARFRCALELHTPESSPFRLHLLPWDDRMDTRHEFRVFCAPAASIEGIRVTAISQYSWWRPIPAHVGSSVALVVAEARRILIHEILTAGEDIVRPLMQGFSFDVLLAGRGCVLVELNGFGALQNTGGALFNWVQDRHVLYGLDANSTIVVRICI